MTKEDKFQIELFNEHWNNFPKERLKLFHVPNGGSRNRIEAAKLKRMGVRAGVADFIFLHKGRAYFIELKYGGDQSPSQSIFEKVVTEEGFFYFLVDADRDLFFKILQDIREGKYYPMDSMPYFSTKFTVGDIKEDSVLMFSSHKFCNRVRSVSEIWKSGEIFLDIKWDHEVLAEFNMFNINKYLEGESWVKDLKVLKFP